MPIDLVLAVVVPTLLAGIFVPLVFIAGASWKWSELDATAKRRVLRTVAGTGLAFGSVGAVVGVVVAAVSGNVWLTAACSSIVIVALATWSLKAAAPVKDRTLRAEYYHRCHRQGDRAATHPRMRQDGMGGGHPKAGNLSFPGFDGGRREFLTSS